MASLKAGDTITCFIKHSKVVCSYTDSDSQVDLEIVARDSSGYFLYVPDYIYLNNTVIISNTEIRLLKINPKFLGSKMLYIETSLVGKVRKILDGMTCVSCHQFYDYAEPNQPNGTLLCFSCRTYPYYG